MSRTDAIKTAKALNDQSRMLRAQRALILMRHRAELYKIDQELDTVEADLSTALATAAQKEEA